MAVRDGMLSLISELRSYCDAGTADFTLDSVTYFSDQHLQDLLDRRSELIVMEALDPIPVWTNGTAYTYTYRFPKGVLWIEGHQSGVAVFSIKDSYGNIIGTTEYTVYYESRHVVFNQPTSGSARLLTTRRFNMYKAAADLWKRKATFYAKDYTFKTGFDHFIRKEKFQNAIKMAQVFESMMGMENVTMVRPDLGWERG